MFNVEESENEKELEEALEFIYDKSEMGNDITKEMIKKEFPRVIGKLEKYNLIERNGEEIKLTKEGNVQATEVIRHHRLAERLLSDLLSVEDDLLEEHACKFEHLIKKDIEERVCALLGHPKICPHNKKIPPGECCKKRIKAQKIISPLNEMKVGDKGKIAYLNTSSDRILEKLLAIGIYPGESIKVIKTKPSYAIKVGMSRFVFDSEVASNIFIRLSD